LSSIIEQKLFTDYSQAKGNTRCENEEERQAAIARASYPAILPRNWPVDKVSAPLVYRFSECAKAGPIIEALPCIPG
jgi:hypothetical protein